MKVKLLFPVLFLSLFIVSCKKDKATTTPLVFSSLTAEADSVAVNALLKIDAVATGDNLTYTWESTGNIVGTGATVNFTICHSDVFTVKCTVTDNASNSASKTISVKSFNP